VAKPKFVPVFQAIPQLHSVFDLTTMPGDEEPTEEDSHLDFLGNAERANDEEHETPAPEGHVAPERLQALFRKFPDADQDYITNLFGKHPDLVGAALRDKKHKRADEALRVFLRLGGVARPEDFLTRKGSVRKGHNAHIVELKDCGFVIRQDAPGKPFYLSHTSFRPHTQERGKLTPAQRLIVLQRDAFACRACRSKSDLEEDHCTPIKNRRHCQPSPVFNPDEWQMLCRPCNRNKRTACGLCPKSLPCNRCRWGNPLDHDHAAGEPGFWLTTPIPPDALTRARDSGLDIREWLLARLKD